MEPRLNTCFLGRTRVSIPNGISVGSIVLPRDAPECIARFCYSNPICLSVCYIREPWLNSFKMFSENNITNNNYYPRDLAHCTTLIIDLTLREQYKMLGERRWGMRKSDICDTKPAIIWSEAVYSQIYYRVHIKTRERPIDWWQIWWPRVNFGLCFCGTKFFHRGNIAHFLSERDEILQRWGSGQSTLFPEFRELWSGVHVIPCGGMHQSFTGALVTWQPSMFADSFSVLSIHHIARGLGASFL